MVAQADLPQAVVVVDPYSSGRFLLYDLKGRNINIICVRSSLKLGNFFLRVYHTHKNYFVETMDFEEYEGGVPELATHIRGMPYKVLAVIGGSEPGVELAEYLAEELQMSASNGTELLFARKDKAEMQDQLRRCGVPAAEQFKSGEKQKLLAWAEARGQWPLVAKPTGGSGSDGIFFCKNLDDLARAHEEIIGVTNPNGVVNTEIALQEFLAGDEYIVDTISYDGQHMCVACWVYKKMRGLPWSPTSIISTQNRLLAPSGEKQDALINYVFRVLDAVGLRYGPCHTEVMFTPRGPILVEVNARMHGLQGPRLIELATGTSKAAYTVDAMAMEGKMFRDRYVPAPSRYLYPVHKQCVQLVLISPVEGFLKSSIQDVISAMNLPSLVEVLPAVQKGQYLSQSRDLPTAAGSALLVHESIEQIEKDIERIREAERSDLYIVSAEPLQDSPKVGPRSGPSSPKDVGSPRLQSAEKAEELWAMLDDQELGTGMDNGVDVEMSLRGFDDENP